MQTKKINTSVKMPRALRDRLKNLARSRNRTLHSLTLQAIETWVDREEKRESLRQAGIQAHEDYISNGLHLTNDEVKKWLSSLASGNDAAPPECHI
jgi:predicted transcriptional regulator